MGITLTINRHRMKIGDIVYFRSSYRRNFGSMERYITK